MEGIEKSYELLSRIKCLNHFHEIKSWVNEQIDLLDNTGKTEWEYCAIKSRYDTLKEFENIINDKIKEIKPNE